MLRTSILIYIEVFLLTACEKTYHGEFIIVNNCNVAIDAYTMGRNAPSIGREFEIHDHIPANHTLSLREIDITDKAMVKGVFVYILKSAGKKLALF